MNLTINGSEKKLLQGALTVLQAKAVEELRRGSTDVIAAVA